MKRPTLAILTILIFTLQAIAQNTDEQWDTYMASYENGKPGSTTLRMDLIKSAPIEKYDFVLVTGLCYESTREDGFPEGESLDLLYKAEDELFELISKETESIFVGSFMYDKKRLGYFYIADQKNLPSVIDKFYKENYSEYEYYLNIREDNEWKYYKDFLYPNEETRNYMADEAVLRKLVEAGDQLTKERRIDHWVYFSSEKEMLECKDQLVRLSFNIESAGMNKESRLPFELHIWRIDKVDIHSIYPITSMLRKEAKKYNGNYDGWETMVVKE